MIIMDNAPQRSAMSATPTWNGLNRAFKTSIGYNATASRMIKGTLPSTKEEALEVIAKGGGSEILPGVFCLGHRSKYTFGGNGYLIVRNNGASNGLIDCARPTEELVEAVRLLGGASYLVLTHTDDMDGHDQWHEQLGCKRIIHEAEVRTGWNARAQRAEVIEVRLGDNGNTDAWPRDLHGPWTVPGGDDVIIHHTPGHSEGHVAIQLLDRQHDRKALFTGDHFGFSQRKKILGFGSTYCGFSYSKQIESVH